MAGRISRIVTTGAGEGLPAAFVKLDGNDLTLQGRLDAQEARLVAFDRMSRPAGFTGGGVAASFLYTVAAGPIAMASKGAASPPVSASGPFLDSDGKVAVIRLTDTRVLVLAQDSTTNNATNILRATVYDLSVAGVPTQVSTTTFAPNNTGWSPSMCAMLGGARITDSACRLAAAWANSPQIWQFVLATLTVDPGTGAIAVTIDANSNSQSIYMHVPTGAFHRRRAYLVGAASVFFPRMQNTLYPNSAAQAAPGGVLVERTPGNANMLPRAFGAIGSNHSQAIDRLTDALFVTLHDAYATGTGLQAQVSLVNVDDVTSAPISTLRLGVGISGSVRLAALSPTLVVAGFTTGSQYATYLIARDPVTNALSLVGGSAIAGLLGTAPVEIVPLSATKALVLTKVAASWALTGTVVTVDPAAAPGANPFTIGTSFSVNLGTGLAGAVAGDTVTVGAVEQLTGDRLLVVYRNATRSLNGMEVLELS